MSKVIRRIPITWTKWVAALHGDSPSKVIRRIPITWTKWVAALHGDSPSKVIRLIPITWTKWVAALHGDSPSKVIRLIPITWTKWVAALHGDSPSKSGLLSAGDLFPFAAAPISMRDRNATITSAPNSATPMVSAMWSSQRACPSVCKYH